MIKKQNNHSFLCHITKEYKKESEVTLAALIRPGLFDLIKKEYPDLKKEDYISTEILVDFRRKYIESVLAKEKGELSKVDKEVIKSMSHHETLSENINSRYHNSRTFGQKVSDNIAEFGGSWKFIMIFFGILVLWISINSLLMFQNHFDPYPFILLNLILSCLAAIQAPIIMMSQNRKEAKDRLRAENDYKVNLKAEIEIRMLHEKMDHLIHQQWQRLLEIQQMQLDLIDDKKKKNK